MTSARLAHIVHTDRIGVIVIVSAWESLSLQASGLSATAALWRLSSALWEGSIQLLQVEQEILRAAFDAHRHRPLFASPQLEDEMRIEELEHLIFQAASAAGLHPEQLISKLENPSGT